MSIVNADATLQHRVAIHGAPRVIFWILVFALLPLAAVLGGMQFLLLGLATGLAVIVWMRPREAPGAGMLFLFAAGILLPYGARFDIAGPIWEMYYWAAGLLIITLAAILRIGLGRIWMIPRSAKVFLLVALLAALYGITHGASTSYVLRQLYGVLLLIAYLAIALQVGDEELLLHRIQFFGILCTLCFLIYYAAVFGEYGFHKEMGFGGEQAAFLAIPLFLGGIEHKRRSWVLGAVAILLLPTLNFTRRDILTFLMALLVALVIRVKSRAVKAFCYGGIALVMLSSLYPPVTEVVAENLLKVPVVDSLIPEGGRDASTLVSRLAMLYTSLETVSVHPWFGTGMGGELEVKDSVTGELSFQVFEDNGWGYLLQKMGLVGTAAFLWLLMTILQSLSSKALGLTACVLSAITVTMFSEPAFLHFTTAPYMGTYAGLLLAFRQRHLVPKSNIPAAFAEAR